MFLRVSLQYAQVIQESVDCNFCFANIFDWKISIIYDGNDATNQQPIR